MGREDGIDREGKLADLIVIDQNVFEAPVTDIYKTKVLKTIVGGNVVYEAN